MPINITMPALSPTMEEGNLAKWHVKVGDTVTAGDVIAEIETDKATMEVEAVDEGTIAKVLVNEGTEAVKVNAVIAILAEDGEDVEAAASADVSASATAPAPEAAPEIVSETTPASSPSPATAPMAGAPGERIFASPLARRIAGQNSLDLALINGTGPHGRIHKRDVEAAMAAGTATAGAAIPVASDTSSPATAGAPMASGPSDQQVLAVYDEAQYEKLAHDGMRKTIASRLTESTQSIPSYNITMECQLDQLLVLRADINASAPVKDDKPAFKLSVNDFLIKALALALQDIPTANASWTSTDRLLHKHSDVGVAVAIPDGLFTPIVRQAELKSLRAISAEVKDMAGRARNKKLLPDEYQGGTTAISNLGMYGVKEFTSIINPPHASILSIGEGRKSPVVRDGELAVGTIMGATFAFDHRVIDGALGAELASAFKRYVEQPMTMLV